MSLTDYPNLPVDRERLINDIYALRVDLQLLSDGLARTAVAPAELPIGLVTALLGAPVFLFLLLRSERATR